MVFDTNSTIAVVGASLAGLRASETLRVEGYDGRIVLTPANPAYEPMILDGNDVTIFGRVVTIVRQV